MAATAISVTVVGATAVSAQSDDELRRELREARERIRQLEQMSGRADLPPMDAGQCYSRVLVPPSPRTVTDTIVVTEARSETRVIPPVFDTVTEPVRVKMSMRFLPIVNCD